MLRQAGKGNRAGKIGLVKTGSLLKSPLDDHSWAAPLTTSRRTQPFQRTHRRLFIIASIRTARPGLLQGCETTRVPNLVRSPPKLRRLRPSLRRLRHNEWRAGPNLGCARSGATSTTSGAGFDPIWANFDTPFLAPVKRLSRARVRPKRLRRGPGSTEKDRPFVLLPGQPWHDQSRWRSTASDLKRTGRDRPRLGPVRPISGWDRPHSGRLD